MLFVCVCETLCDVTVSDVSLFWLRFLHRLRRRSRNVPSRCLLHPVSPRCTSWSSSSFRRCCFSDTSCTSEFHLRNIYEEMDAVRQNLSRQCRPKSRMYTFTDSGSVFSLKINEINSVVCVYLFISLAYWCIRHFSLL